MFRLSWARRVTGTATARLALALVPALVLACGDDGASPSDAGPTPDDAAQVQDASVTGDAPPALTWVDFAIAGCTLIAPGDGGPPSCQGPAPLSVQLSAVAPGAVDVYLWELGNPGSPGDPDGDNDAGPDDDADAGPGDSDAGPGESDAGPGDIPDPGPGLTLDGPTPSHVYELPGTYDISLTVRGPGGSAMITRRSAVIVTPAALGARCDRDAHCGDSRECVCDAGSACPASLAGGLCSAGCDPETPCAEGVCTNLAAARPDAPADWQRALCLPACDPAGACPQSLTCQELPAGDGNGWVQACFAPGVLGSMGSACKDASGAPDHQACAGGLCLDIGARGACASRCDGDGAPCPASSACAAFGDPEQSFCLLRCADAATDCQADPWLACEQPGAPDGFTVSEPASPDGYCAPRSCAGPDACGADGVCTAQGYCGPR
jgi:PKD repeat protein